MGLIDYDGDGWLDIYFVNGCPIPWTRQSAPAQPAVSQPADGTFGDVTDRAGVGGNGYGMGCAVGDFDNDGHDDLFVTGLNGTILYRNRGDGTFEDVTVKPGSPRTAGRRPRASATWTATATSTWSSSPTWRSPR